MPQFEIDLPTAMAKRFDRAVHRFVVAELICRPDVDLSIAAYPTAPGIQRRAVYMSSTDHLQAFRQRWTAISRLGLAGG